MSLDMETTEESQILVDQDEDDSIYELIRRVEPWTFLYNCRDPKHSRRDAVSHAWDEVAKDLKVKGKPVNGAWCKKKWKSLRDYYFKVKKSRKGKSGDGAKRKYWTYYSSMDRVLASFVEENSSTQTNMPGDDSSEDENHTDHPTPDNNVTLEKTDGHEEAERSTSESTPTTCKKIPKRKIDRDDSLNEKIMKVLEEPEDRFYYFAMSFSDRLRSLPLQTAEYIMMRMNNLYYEIMYPPNQMETFNYSTESTH